MLQNCLLFAGRDGLISPLLLDRSTSISLIHATSLTYPVISTIQTLHLLPVPPRFFLCSVQRSWWPGPGPLTPQLHSEHYLGPSKPPLPSLVLPLRPQHPAAMLMLLWVAGPTPRSRSISHWLSVRSVRPGWLGEADPPPPGCLEEMVRKM